MPDLNDETIEGVKNQDADQEDLSTFLAGEGGIDDELAGLESEMQKKEKRFEDELNQMMGGKPVEAAEADEEEGATDVGGDAPKAAEESVATPDDADGSAEGDTEDGAEPKTATPAEAEDTLAKFEADMFAAAASVPPPVAQAQQLASQESLQTQQGQPIPQPAQMPAPMALTPDPAALPSFVTEEDHAAMLESPTRMNQILGQVFLKAQQDAVARVQSHIPRMIDTNVQQQVTERMIVREFYRENPDLTDAPALAVLNDYSTRIQSAHPEWTLDQNFLAAERGARLALNRPKNGVQAPTKIQGKRVVDKTVVRRAVMKGPAARPAPKQELKPEVPEEFAQMGDSVNKIDWEFDETAKT